MIKINKFILIICFILLLLMYLICKNDILNTIKNMFNLNNKELKGGNIELGNLKNEIEKEKNVISQMLNELESLRNNKKSLNQLIKNDNENKQYIKIDRPIIEDTNNDAITHITEDKNNELNETSESNDTSDDENDNNESNNNITKPWENLCEKDYNEKKKKHKYEDLKLELNTQMNLEPFNNDDFSEFGKFNC